jgi:hypothetical protein
MGWLERLREKNRNVPPLALTKLTKAGYVRAEETFVSFVSGPPEGNEDFQQPPATRSTSMDPMPPEIIRVPYQAIWYDYDLRDGVYSSEQLRQARKILKRGPVRHYLLRWQRGRLKTEGACHAARV